MSFTRLFGLLLLPILAHAEPAQLELANGDTLHAEVITADNNSVTFIHPVLGEVTLPAQHIKVTHSGAPQPVQQLANVETKSPENMKSEDNGLLGTGLLRGWERRLDLGVAGSTGKSKNMQVNLGFVADYESQYTRISSTSAYFRAESEGELTDDSFYSVINRDWLRPETPWFHFAGGRADLDRFKDWDYRLAGNGGMGYEFYNTESFLFLSRIGLGFSQTFGGEREEFTPEGLLGVETKWRMNEHQKIKFANTLYPNLKDNSEFRNLTSFDWILDLNSYVGVALKLGLLNEYDSQAEDGVSNNDFKYTVSLAWTL